MSGRGASGRVRLLLPGRAALHRKRRLQTLYVDGLGVEPNGTVGAVQVHVGQARRRDLVRPGLDHHLLRSGDLQGPRGRLEPAA